MLMSMRHTHPDLQFHHILPYGPIVHDNGVQFVVFSRNATEMRLLLYDAPEDREPVEIIKFHRDTDRWGDIWSIFVPGLGYGQLYHFQASGPYEPTLGHRFDATARLIDPYARALAGEFQTQSDGIIRPPKCVVVDERFDWEGDRHIRRNLSETVIYEMHVRGFTRDDSSETNHPGTYLGVIEKIPYLTSLGVTAVELMPVHEFPTNHPNGSHEGPLNYWGYDTLAFFSPHRGYAFDSTPGAQVREFKQMVKALHNAGIEVILDVVYNHTCEGNHLGPTLSFKGLENSVYYMLEADARYYRNYSGCGNTINGNHPVVREMIFNSLRHWVHNYHIDGFRFDLASILNRDRSGNLVPNPPLVEVIGEDPLLTDTKIIAEAWDAAGAYQVGTFGDHRWAEWNGRFRDDVRKYWRGEPQTQGAMATRLSGSSDLYRHSGRNPLCSINLVTSHDGYTLNDLVSYEQKHNQANGEDNRDGENHNLSCNYGQEGPSDSVEIEPIRQRQVRNFLTSLLLSQGVPMIVSGDECRRTQGGNNNAYCQDNPTSWFDWSLVETHRDLVRFARELIHFRRRQPTVRQPDFLTDQLHQDDMLPDVLWYGADGKLMNWELAETAMTCWLSAPSQVATAQTTESTGNPTGSIARDLLFFFNPLASPTEFQVPARARIKSWRQFIDTAAASPNDITPGEQGRPLSAKSPIQVAERGTQVFVSELA